MLCLVVEHREVEQGEALGVGQDVDLVDFATADGEEDPAYGRSPVKTTRPAVPLTIVRRRAQDDVPECTLGDGVRAEHLHRTARRAACRSPFVPRHPDRGWREPRKSSLRDAATNGHRRPRAGLLRSMSDFTACRTRRRARLASCLQLGRPIDDRRDLIERHAEHAAEHNASRSGGVSGSRTTSIASPIESARSACCSGSIPPGPLRIGSGRWKPTDSSLLAFRVRKSIEAEPGNDSRQPSAQVGDLARIRSIESGTMPPGRCRPPPPANRASGTQPSANASARSRIAERGRLRRGLAGSSGRSRLLHRFRQLSDEDNESKRDKRPGDYR